MANKDLNVILGLRVKDFQKSLRKAERSLKRTARNLQNIGTDLTQSISLPIAGIGLASIQAAGDIEALEKGLKAVLPAGESAREELEKLRKVAELPGLGFEQAVRGSVRLQAIGFNADQSRESLAAFGRVVAVTGGTAQELDSVVRQITQINAKGRILAEDLNIIQENAPAIGIALQDAFGTTNVEAIRESGISAGEFTKRLVEAINSGEEFQKVQGGLKNAIENVTIATRIFLSDLGKEINRLFDVQGIAERFASTLADLSAKFNALDDDTKRTIITIGAVAAAIGPVLLIIGKLTSVATLAVTGFKALSGVFISVGRAAAVLVGAISAPVAIIIGIGAAVVFAYTRFETFRRVINGVIEVAKELIRIAKETLSGIVNGFAALRDGKFAKAAVAQPIAAVAMEAQAADGTSRVFVIKNY